MAHKNNFVDGEIVLGEGYPIVGNQAKRGLLHYPDADRSGHFWCFGTTRVGKAQPLDAPVHTPDGWAQMKEIKVGSIVSTPDGAVSNVLEVFPQGVIPIYKITFDDGRTAEASGDHLWEIHHKHWIGKYKPGKSRAGCAKPRIMTTLQLRAQIERNKGVFGVQLVDAVEKPKIELPIHPYVLGCLLGDGLIGKGDKLTFCTESPEIVERINSFLPDGLVLNHVGPKKIDYAFNISSDRQRVGKIKKVGGYVKHPMRQAVSELGLSGTRSWEKHIPHQYLESCIEDRLEMLRGLLDTDGTVTKTGVLQFDTSSERLAAGVQELVWSLGGKVNKRKKKRSYTKDGQRILARDSYHLTIRHPNPRLLITLSTRRNRLPVNYRYASSSLKLVVKSIEYSRDAEAQCIMLDDAKHLYITNQYVVTHNTRIIENMIEQDVHKGNSIFVVDPKGDLELFSKIVQIAAEAGREDELCLITPIFPEFSGQINPLQYYYTPEELTGIIVSGVAIGKDPFYYNVAYEISLVLVQALLLIAEHERTPRHFNLNDVKNLISKAEIDKVHSKICAIDSNTAREISDKLGNMKDAITEERQLAMDMQKIAESPTDYYAKVSSSLRVALMELTSGNIGKIIGKARSNNVMKRLEEGKRVICIMQLGSLLMRQAAFTTGKVGISMLQSFVGRVYASGRKINPALCIYIDEAQSVLYQGIDDFFAKGGGANAWIHGFSQSINQMWAALGKDYANSILDNTNTKLFLRAADKETAKYVAEHFGTHKVLSPIMNFGQTATAREVEEDIVKPSDILDLKKRAFYLMTYKGQFKGKTLDVSPATIEVEFPNASVVEEA